MYPKNVVIHVTIETCRNDNQTRFQYPDKNIEQPLKIYINTKIFHPQKFPKEKSIGPFVGRKRKHLHIILANITIHDSRMRSGITSDSLEWCLAVAHVSPRRRNLSDWFFERGFVPAVPSRPTRKVVENVPYLGLRKGRSSFRRAQRWARKKPGVFAARFGFFRHKLYQNELLLFRRL